MPKDGLMAMLEVVSGRSRPRSGTVRVAGADPARSPRLRARLGVLGVRPVLPEAATAGTVAAWAAQAAHHGRTDALELLGLERLTQRPVRSLGLAEARAVELGIALSIPEPYALVLYEPLVDLAAGSPASLREALRARATNGACVLVATSSVADAALLGDEVHVLRQGRMLGSLPLIAASGSGVRELALWVDPVAGGGARALGSALGARRELAGVGWQAGATPGAPELVAVRTFELDRAALAVAEECTRLGVAVLSLDSTPPSLEQVIRDAWGRTAGPTAPPGPGGPSS